MSSCIVEMSTSFRDSEFQTPESARALQHWALPVSPPVPATLASIVELRDLINQKDGARDLTCE
jgi:hypothetical protein